MNLRFLFALCLLVSAASAQTVGISACAFAGAGLNDATCGGRFTTAPGNHSYVVTISATGTPDHFTWTKDGGAASAPVAITGSAQTLSDGVTITFAATTGHTLAANWTITVTASGSVVTSSFIGRGVGAQFRPAQDKLRDTASVTDFGADITGTSDSVAAFTRAMTASQNVTVPAGTYRMASALAIPAPGANGGRTITGSGLVKLVFTGATDGLQLPTGNGVTIEGLTLTTTNGAPGKAIHASGSSSGNVLRNITVVGAWPYGIYADSDMESSSIYSLNCQSVTVCVSLNGTSNANQLVGLVCGGSSTTCVATDAASNSMLTGGVVQGNVSTGLITTTNDLTAYGTWMENANGAAPAVFGGNTTSTQAVAVYLDGVRNNTSSTGDIFKFSGPGTVIIHGMSGASSSGGCLIRHTGATGTPVLSHLVITDSTLYNFGSGQVICLNAGSSDTISQATIAHNFIKTLGSTVAISIDGSAASRVVIEGNNIVAGTHGISTTGVPSLTYSFNQFNSTDVCFGCLGSEVQVGNLLNGSPVGPNIGATSAASTTPTWQKASVLYIANGVSGCANANGCWKETSTNGTVTVVAAAASALQPLTALTPGITFMWLNAVMVNVTAGCAGSTGPNIARIGDNSSSLEFGSPAWSISATGKHDLVTSVGGSIVTSNIVTLSVGVTAGTVDQTTPGCAFDAYFMLGTNQ